MKNEAKPPIDAANLAYRELYRLDEVAFLLGVSRRTVTSLITIQCRTGRPRLCTVRVGRCVRVTRTEVERFVARLVNEAR